MMNTSFTESPAVSVTSPLKPDTSGESILSSSIIRPSKFTTFSLGSSVIQPSKFHDNASQSSSVSCNVLSVSQLYSYPLSRRDPNEFAVLSPFDDEQEDCIPSPLEEQVNAFSFLGTSKAQNVKPRVFRRKRNHLKGHLKGFKRRRQRYFSKKSFKKAICFKQEPMDVSTIVTSDTKDDPKDSDVPEVDGNMDVAYL
ncbi:uncharacterized protein [Palaemon carinicauda]|uniref:uncharacterized protein n=1 Tax=Palaemon carinicauda TaxID=392227 RepID=UPI0035B5CFC9